MQSGRIARRMACAAGALPIAALRIGALACVLPLAIAAYYAIAPASGRKRAAASNSPKANPVPARFLTLTGWICGLRVEVIGTQVSGPRLILANHVSWLDIMALARTSASAFVAHDGLAGFGPLRWLCAMNRTVFIARENRADIARQVDQVRNALTSGDVLTIFPEGTTSETGLPFRSSLLAALDTRQSPPASALSVTHGTVSAPAIQPVLLDYGHQTRNIAWVGTESGLINALRILGRWRPVRLTVHFLPPLLADQHRGRKTIALAAQNAITSARLRQHADV